MCGILGQFNYSEKGLVSLDITKKMLTRLHHRGPDESGIYLEDFIGLGHARLSIIDLKSGQQPMSCRLNRYWIVFNGEIFNYIELREELQKKGYQFKTQSDTEVLLNLYIEYGVLCLHKLNGQFAFAIWDKKLKKLFLARDRVGIRPLFYTKNKGSFVFASEIKSFIENPNINLEFSPRALNEIFTLWTTISPNTAFKNIYELPPGCFMIVDKQHSEIKPYWELNFPDQNSYSHIKEESLLEEFNELFTDAVKIRLRADVPIGAYLSGGIDSSITTHYIKKLFPNSLKTFSIGFSDAEFDESHYQKIAVEYFKTKHSNVFCSSKDISNIFPKIIWHTEIPIIRTAPAPMYLLSKLVRNQSFKVVITGEGADEMLAGYNIFKEMRIRRFWARDPQSKYRPLLLKKLYPYLSHLKDVNNNLLKLFFGYKLSDTDSLIYSHLLRWNNTNRIQNHFSDIIKEQIRGISVNDNILRKLPPDFSNIDPLSKAQWLESTIFMSGYLLSSQGDRMAMANSVEGRYPFLDHRIIEFCSKLTPDYKLSGLTEKRLLKILMKDKLPSPIIKRPKQAYRAPAASSFLTRIPEYLHEILSDEQILNCGVFNPESVQNLIKKLKSGKQISEVDNMSLTGIVSTQLLYNQFISKNYLPDITVFDKNLKIINTQNRNHLSEFINK